MDKSPDLVGGIITGNYIHDQVKIVLGINTRSSGTIVSYEDYNAALLNVIGTLNQSNGMNGMVSPNGEGPPPYPGPNDPVCKFCGGVYDFGHICPVNPYPPGTDPPGTNPPGATPEKRLANGVRLSGATKGDIIITLADDVGAYEHPYVPGVIWSNGNPNYQVGHVGVFNFTPQASDSDNTLLNGETIEAWNGPSNTNNTIKDQVMYRSILDWSNATAVYILGVHHWSGIAPVLLMGVVCHHFCLPL